MAKVERSVELTKLSELAVGQNKSSKGSETLQGLVSVLLGSIFVNGCAWELCITGSDVLGFPDELLEQVALVLGEEQVLCLLNDIFHIAKELFAFIGELCVGLVKGIVLKSAIQSDVDLLVLRHIMVRMSITGVSRGNTHRRSLSLSECAVDAVQLKLVVDVSLLELLVCRVIDS